MYAPSTTRMLLYAHTINMRICCNGVPSCLECMRAGVCGQVLAVCSMLTFALNTKQDVQLRTTNETCLPIVLARLMLGDALGDVQRSIVLSLTDIVQGRGIEELVGDTANAILV